MSLYVLSQKKFLRTGFIIGTYADINTARKGGTGKMSKKKNNSCEKERMGKHDWDSKGVISRKIADYEIQTCYFCKKSRLVKIEYLQDDYIYSTI